jgi:hypothetical protein
MLTRLTSLGKALAPSLLDERAEDETMKRTSGPPKLLKGIAPVLLGVASIVLSVSPAFASLMLEINVPNTAGTGFTGPYATVTINLTDATHAAVTFTSLTNGGNTYYMGDGSSVALNVNGGFTATSINAVASPVNTNGLGPWTVNIPGGQVDGFGNFNLTIDDFDGATHSATQISFTLTNTSGTWGTEEDVLVANAKGYSAAAHLFPSSNLANTFLAGDGPPTVAEPSTLLLLGSGLMGFAYLAVRRRRESRS